MKHAVFSRGARVPRAVRTTPFGFAAGAVIATVLLPGGRAHAILPPPSFGVPPPPIWSPPPGGPPGWGEFPGPGTSIPSGPTFTLVGGPWPGPGGGFLTDTPPSSGPPLAPPPLPTLATPPPPPVAILPPPTTTTPPTPTTTPPPPLPSAPEPSALVLAGLGMSLAVLTLRLASATSSPTPGSCGSAALRSRGSGTCSAGTLKAVSRKKGSYGSTDYRLPARGCLDGPPCQPDEPGRFGGHQQVQDFGP
jgi:hypothetical protein